MPMQKELGATRSEATLSPRLCEKTQWSLYCRPWGVVRRLVVAW